MHESDVALEFVLPRTLINLPVDLYMRQVRAGEPRPLSCDYPIVVRPLERMIGKQWHRVLRAKWRTLVSDPDGTDVYIAETWDGESYSTAVSLKEPKVVSMVPTNAPSEVVGPYDELTAVLSAGLPPVLWSRRDSDAAELYDVATQLGQSGGPSTLPSHFFSRVSTRSTEMIFHSVEKLFEASPCCGTIRGALTYLGQLSWWTRRKGDTADERAEAFRSGTGGYVKWHSRPARMVGVPGRRRAA
ncbi:hypothetical protein ACFQ1S_07335, partial [Kibdelosporangium lantanae]